MDGFIRVYDGTRYLVLFWSVKYDYVYDRIKYLISVKSGITDLIPHNYAKIKVDSCDSLSLGKTITFHNVTILMKSVYYNIFSEKASDELPKNKFLY